MKKKKSAKKSKGDKGGSKILIFFFSEQGSAEINPALVLVDLEQVEIDDKATELVMRHFHNNYQDLLVQCG